MWEYWIHDTRTGNPLSRVMPVSCSGTSTIAGTGDASTVFKVKGSLPEPIGDLLVPSARMLVVQWGSASNAPVVYAGYLLEPDYDRDAQKITVVSKELRSLFDVRSFGAAHLIGSDPASWDLIISRRSMSGAVRAILNRIMTYSVESELPIDLPADGAGGYSKAYRYWEQYSTQTALQEIEKAGWEIHLRPYKTGGRLRFQTLVAPKIARSTYDLIVTTQKSPVTGLHVRRLGDEQFTGMVAIGKGTGPDMLLRGASSNVGGIPARDGRISAKDVDDPAQLQAIVDARMAAAAGVPYQASYKVRLGGAVTPEWVLPGTIHRLDMTGDPFWPGVHQQRVTSVQWAMSQTMTPETENV